MLFQTFTPSLALKRFVSTYICVEGENAVPLSPPRSSTAIKFCFDKGKKTKDTFFFQKPKRKQEVRYPSAHLVCLFDQIGLEKVEGFYHILFVQLTPLALPHLLRRTVNDLTNQVIPLEELLPNVPLLMEQLEEIEGFAEKIKVIEPFLIQSFEKNYYKHSEVDTAVYFINQCQGNIKIKEIQNYCNVSERTLERKFREQLGFSPKEYARIVRFKNVMQYMLLHPKTAWVELAYHFGYADQSHLCKDFQYFAEVNPEKLMENDFFIEKVFLTVA